MIKVYLNEQKGVANTTFPFPDDNKETRKNEQRETIYRPL